MPDEIRVQQIALDQNALARRVIDRFRGSRNAYVDFGAAGPVATQIVTLPAEATRIRVIAIVIHTDTVGEIDFYDAAAGGVVKTTFPTIEVAANSNVILNIDQLGGGLILTTGLRALPTAATFEVWVSYLYEKDVPED